MQPIRIKIQQIQCAVCLLLSKKVRSGGDDGNLVMFSYFLMSVVLLVHVMKKRKVSSSLLSLFMPLW